MITGFPGSGTSLMGGLVYALDVPMGPLESLKMRGETNPRGYYEHRAIWAEVDEMAPDPYHGFWNCGEMIGNVQDGNLGCQLCGDTLTDDGKILPNSKFRERPFDPLAVQRIARLAERDNVVALKHATFPFIHEYFPSIEKCVVIYRSAEDLVQPTTSIGLRIDVKDENGQVADPDILRKYYVQPSHDYWWKLFNLVVKERQIETIQFSYKEWKTDFDINIVRLADFLGVDLTDERKQICRELVII